MRCILDVWLLFSFQFASCLTFFVFALVQYFPFFLSFFIFSSFLPFVELCFLRSLVSGSFGVRLLLALLIEDLLPSDLCLFLSFAFQEGN